MYGRTETDWDELVRAGRAYLEEVARMQDKTTYKKLNERLEEDTGQQRFDFGRPDHLNAISKLLAEIATQSVAEYGLMLTALVVHQDGSVVGGGFYKFAQNHPDLPLSLGASKVEKDAFWIAQLNAVHEEYSANRTRRQGFG